MKKIKITEEFDIEEVIASLNKILQYTERVNEYKAITNGIKVIDELLNKLEKQEIKVDSNLFTDEAKKQLEQWYGCFRTYDSENEACQYCCLKDECKRRTKEYLESEENKKCLPLCFGKFEENNKNCEACSRRNECQLKTKEIEDSYLDD